MGAGALQCKALALEARLLPLIDPYRLILATLVLEGGILSLFFNE
jgi:hypothetical protein